MNRSDEKSASEAQKPVKNRSESLEAELASLAAMLPPAPPKAKDNGHADPVPAPNANPSARNTP